MAKHKRHIPKAESSSENSQTNSSTKLAFYKRPHFYFLLIVPVAGVLLVVQLLPPISSMQPAKTSPAPIISPVLPPVVAPVATKADPIIPTVLPPALPTAKVVEYQRHYPSVFPGARVAFPKVKAWVQGEPITRYEPGKIYFIEFFSTNCSHCAEQAPLVAEIVRTYQPLGVEFIAISKEEQPVLLAWLNKPETKVLVSYRVASDPNLSGDRILQFGTFKNSTPRVFLIKDGIVQWYGHPTLTEKPLASLVAGTWDPLEIKDEFVLTSQVEQAKDQITAKVTACEKTGDWQPALDLIDSIVQAFPEKSASFQTQRFTVMIGIGNMPEAGYALGKKLVAEYPSDIATLRSLARTTLNSPFVQKRDLDFAMQTALAADALGKNEDARAAEVVAFAYFSKGDREHAIENQERAIRLQTDAVLLKQYHTSLEKYKTAEPGPIPYQPPHKTTTGPPVVPAVPVVPAG